MRRGSRFWVLMRQCGLRSTPPGRSPTSESQRDGEDGACGPITWFGWQVHLQHQPGGTDGSRLFYRREGGCSAGEPGRVLLYVQVLL